MAYPEPASVQYPHQTAQDVEINCRCGLCSPLDAAIRDATQHQHPGITTITRDELATLQDLHEQMTRLLEVIQQRMDGD